MASINRADSCPTMEEEVIKELKERISDVISEDGKFDDDVYLILWLRAGKFDPASTELLIRNSVQWRKEIDVESVDEEIFQDFKKIYGAYWGTARDGRLLCYNVMGKRDYRKGVSTYGKQLWIKLWAKLFFNLEEKMIAFNKSKNISTQRVTNESAWNYVDIQNARGASIVQVMSVDAMSSGFEIVRNLTVYFPPMAQQSIMFNVNKVAKVFFKLVKPLIDKPHLTYEIMGSDDAEWRTRLLEIMDEEQLQTFLKVE